jgi:hypothetical protein
MKQYFIQFALLMAGAWALGANAQAQETMKAEAMKAEAMKMPTVLKVEVLVYSGRPNPVFVVSDPKEVKEILSLAKSLPANKSLKAGESGMPESKLGYQGMIVTNTTLLNPEIRSFVVNGAAVQLAVATPTATKTGAQAPVATAARLDPQTSLESKLLAVGKESGIVDEKLLEFIENSK